MRILYHHRTLADGAEGIHIAEMVDAFRALGHEVRVMGLGARDGKPTAEGWIGRLRAGLPASVFEAAAIAANLVEYAHVRRTIGEFSPDVVYKRHARNDVGAISAARSRRIPVVLEINCLFTGQAYRRFEPLAFERAAARLERRALRLATARVAVSTPLAAQIHALAGVEAVVIPNGADPNRFDPARAHGAAVRERYGLGDTLVVGWTGVIRDWHGLDLLVNAVAQVPGAKLLIVGDGPGRAAVDAHARVVGVADRMTITGRIPHREVPDHLAALDVAVIASDRTGVASPMKLLEYMAMERAVAAPALPNIGDVITHGIDGWLFRPDDTADLVRALNGLGLDGALRERLGRAARRAIVGRRNWQHIAAQVLAALPQAGAGQTATGTSTLLEESLRAGPYPLERSAIGSNDDVA